MFHHGRTRSPVPLHLLVDKSILRLSLAALHGSPKLTCMPLKLAMRPAVRFVLIGRAHRL